MNRNKPIDGFSKWLLTSAREEAEKYFNPENLICLIPRETIWYSICLFESGNLTDGHLANRIIENITATDGTHSQSSLIIIWHRYKEKLSIKAKDNIMKNISNTFPVSAFTKFNDGNVNHPIAAYCNLICGGEILGKSEISNIGKFFLSDFSKRINKESFSFKQSQISEYNSPTYTALTIWFLNIISAYSIDTETRELAKSLEYYFWKDVALHFHAPTMQFAGPFSRAYQDDSIGGYSALHCTMIKALGNEIFLYPEISHKYNHPSNFIQNALIAILNFNLPDNFNEIVFNKTFPLYFRQKTFCEQYFENRTKTINQKPVHIFDDECYPGGWSDLTTYMTNEYSLGTAERQYVNGGHTDSFIFRYRRNRNIQNMGDFRSIHTRGVYNDSVPGQDNQCHITDSVITKDYLYEEGRSGIYQNKDKAIICYFPKRSGNKRVRSFRIDIICSYFSEFDDLFINDEKIKDFPIDFAYRDRIIIKDSNVMFTIIPFKISGVDDLKNRIWIKNDLLIISLYSYIGEVHDFGKDEINQMVNGFFFESSEIRKDGNISEFTNRIKKYAINCSSDNQLISVEVKARRQPVENEWDVTGNVRNNSVCSENDEFSMKMVYDYYREKMIERKFDGEEQFLDSFYIESGDICLNNYYKKGL